MATTLTQFRTRIRRDIDMQEEQFITDAELNSYINEGIIEAERLILTLHEDYFLTTGSITLDGAGLPWFDLPSDIYANKIRKLVYDDGGTIEYEIKRIRDLRDVYALDDLSGSIDYNYHYLLLNDATAGQRLRIYPTPVSDPSSNIDIYYIRNANQLSSDSDQTDIPEFETFISWYAKVQCLEKEAVNPMLQTARDNLARERQMLQDTLMNMVPDEDNMILPNMSFYDDFDNFDYGGDY